MNFSQRLKVNPEGTEVKTYVILCKGTLAHIIFPGWPKWHSVSQLLLSAKMLKFSPMHWLSCYGKYGVVRTLYELIER